MGVLMLVLAMMVGVWCYEVILPRYSFLTTHSLQYKNKKVKCGLALMILPSS
jgi:hypothetical protein